MQACSSKAGRCARSLFGTSALLLLILTSCGSGSSDSVATFTVQSNLVYGKGEVDGGGTFIDLALDLYIPDDATQPRPLIVMIHGGGFAIGSKNDGPVVAYSKRYAEHGFVVASIDYRLAESNPVASARVNALKERVGGSFASADVRAFVAAVDDVLTALECLQMREDVDPQRTVLWGTSAGAQTALIAGYALDDYGITRPPVAAVIELGGGFYDLSLGTPFDDPESDPALFVAHGTLDSTAPYSLAVEIDRWARAAGLPLDLHPIEGADHFIDMLNIEVSPGVSLHQRSIDWLANEVFLEP